MTDLFILDHVHWDREWYRPHEAFRSRLLELVERIVDQLERGERPRFHLDGQTITVADVLTIRPELEPRLASLVRDGRLTIGPWHVLADNQLVSGECLVRNLLIARRWGERLGGLAEQGYSPDAFGHPADLPRVLRGFGLTTALVWRGAPPEHARFRWRSPDGSEVFTVNQRYHEAEVMWEPDTAPSRLQEFIHHERSRLPDGPWLLMNGGDHLLPRRVDAQSALFTDIGVKARHASLPDFFAAAQQAAASADLPVVTGDLRHLGDRLTFLLAGTLSTRTYLKQANVRSQTALTEWAEPLSVLAPSTEAPGLLRHAWDLMVQNSPHDSVCGCSVDAVHEQNLLRAERVLQVANAVTTRALQQLGLETRRIGRPAATQVEVAVLNPHARRVTGGVELAIETSPDRWPVAMLDAQGTPVPFDAEDLGCVMAFEADLELMPDSAKVRRHRIAFLARDTPARGQSTYRVLLSGQPTPGARWEESRRAVAGELVLEIQADAALTVRDGHHTMHGLGRLVDGGDRGDTYTWDPPKYDDPILARLVDAQVRHGQSGTRLKLRAVLDLPTGLTDDRTARSQDTASVPVDISITVWHGISALVWRVDLDNTVNDHRLRFHVPATEPTSRWVGDGLYSLIERATGPHCGALPSEPGQEAEIGVAPVQSVAAIGEGAGRIAVFCSGLPEVQGLGDGPGGTPELAVTLLRSVGWLSRFDLATRTAGAGPQFETPDAQCHSRQSFTLGIRWGESVADDLALAAAAAEHRAPLLAVQVHDRPTPPLEAGDVLAVDGAVVTTWKMAEDGRGSILRINNPTSAPRVATLNGSALQDVHSIEHTDLDEHPATPAPKPPDPALTLHLKPFELRTIRLLS